MESAILSTAYLGPISYYSVLLNAHKVLIEQYDSYIKQTYRNRCTILTANGPYNLVVPVVKTSGKKQLVKDVKIDYSTRWQANHWRSIFSAYNSSPFFEYFSDNLSVFYEKRWKFLIDYNTELMLLMLDDLGIECAFTNTALFKKDYKGFSDFREIISPKKASENYGLVYIPGKYSQTFGEKFDFIPNLSIIDLLFNMGPGAEEKLNEQMISFE